jgi:alkylation response protein AidB-like acyl-CoA dehydrogenase
MSPSLTDKAGDIAGTAQRLADDLLFPAAPVTDAAPLVPSELLDALAAAGLYGISGPTWAGGLDADLPTVCAAAEALSSGCLATAFVWAQHLGVVRAAAASENPWAKERVSPLCAGDLRAGVALAGALAGQPGLRATPGDDGWSFAGTAPFVSGWGLVDVLHVAAAAEDGRLVWALIDARESETLSAQRLDLVALNATGTVRLQFWDHPISPERVTNVAPLQQGPAAPGVLRMHASFALGVIARCCRLLGPTPLDGELERVRAELDRLDPATIERARGDAGALALRAAGTLAVATGSRSLMQGGETQLLAREALFTLVYALRPGSRQAALAALGVTDEPAAP